MSLLLMRQLRCKAVASHDLLVSYLWKNDLTLRHAFFDNMHEISFLVFFLFYYLLK